MKIDDDDFEGILFASCCLHYFPGMMAAEAVVERLLCWILLMYSLLHSLGLVSTTGCCCCCIAFFCFLHRF